MPQAQPVRLASLRALWSAEAIGAQDEVAVAELDDGAEHLLRLTWDAKEMALSVCLDDALEPTFRYEADIVGQRFAGNSVIRLAVTGQQAYTPTCSSLLSTLTRARSCRLQFSVVVQTTRGGRRARE